MHVNQQPYRELHDAMLGRGGEQFGAKSLAAWLDRNGEEVGWLRRLRERYGASDRVPDEDLWRLYAMSRVIQKSTWVGSPKKERIELLSNRCFITTAKPSGDLFPYDDKPTKRKIVPLASTICHRYTIEAAWNGYAYAVDETRTIKEEFVANRLTAQLNRQRLSSCRASISRM